MKENKIEKLILDLSAAWKCSPEEVVDRLNSMNESEINKLINSMTKKFLNGGLMDCLRAGGNLTECKKCGGKAPIKAVGGSIPSKRYANRFEDSKKNQNTSTSDTTKKKEIVKIPGLHKQLGPTIPPLSKPNKKK